MNTETLITITSLIIANIGTSIFLFTWATNHAANDSRNIREQINNSAKETRDILSAIQAEMKDFHGRLCDIEANRKG